MLKRKRRHLCKITFREALLSPPFLFSFVAKNAIKGQFEHLPNLWQSWNFFFCCVLCNGVELELCIMQRRCKPSHCAGLPHEECLLHGGTLTSLVTLVSIPRSAMILRIASFTGWSQRRLDGGGAGAGLPDSVVVVAAAAAGDSLPFSSSGTSACIHLCLLMAATEYRRSGSRTRILRTRDSQSEREGSHASLLYSAPG